MPNNDESIGLLGKLLGLILGRNFLLGSKILTANAQHVGGRTGDIDRGIGADGNTDQQGQRKAA